MSSVFIFYYVMHSTHLWFSFQVFEIQSISVKAGQTPLPAVWALEMTSDVKSDFRGVRYYVANQEDCLKHFGVTRFDNDVDDPVCHSQSERSWTEREDVSSQEDNGLLLAGMIKRLCYFCLLFSMGKPIRRRIFFKNGKQNSRMENFPSGCEWIWIVLLAQSPAIYRFQQVTRVKIGVGPGTGKAVKLSRHFMT